MQQYRRRKTTPITAVQLNLDTEGFVYQKWGGTQRCKRGDWLVNNQDDVYTVDGESFARTYRPVSPGVYIKDAHIWAKQAEQSGTIHTKEGSTAYDAGDYIVFNDAEGKDGYALSQEKFHSLYELAEK